MDLSSIKQDISGRILVIFNHNRIDQRLLKNSLILANYLFATIDILYFIEPQKTIHSSSPHNALGELEDENERVQKKLDNICQLIYQEEGTHVNFCIRTGNATDQISKYITQTQPDLVALVRPRLWIGNFALPRYLSKYTGSVYVQGKYDLPKAVGSLSIAYMMGDACDEKKDVITSFIDSIPKQVNYFQLAMQSVPEGNNCYKESNLEEPFEFDAEKDKAIVHYIGLLKFNVLFFPFNRSLSFEKYQAVLNRIPLPFFIQKS